MAIHLYAFTRLRVHSIYSETVKGTAREEGSPPAVDKQMWMEMLRAAGLSDQARKLWHAEFELRAPEAHHKFLLSPGISEKEVLLIRNRSHRKKADENCCLRILP